MMVRKSNIPQISLAQWLADLSWAAHSPVMTAFADFQPTLPENLFITADEQASVDSDARTLPKTGAPAPVQLSSHFLGPYFEQLWRNLIVHSNNLELMAHSLQVHHQGRTLGEFDFLLKRTGAPETILPEIIHQEVAVKFYLGLPAGSNTAPSSLWFGPNLQDRLDLKIHKLLTEQVMLSRNQQAKLQLASAGFHHIKPEIMVKGYLFHPYRQTLPLPVWINPDTPTGWWLPWSQFTTKFNDLNDQYDGWAILPKLAWLAPATRDYRQTLSGQPFLTELKQQMSSGKPQLIAGLNMGKCNKMTETTRFFVVGDHWQAKASQALLQNPEKQITAPVCR